MAMPEAQAWVASLLEVYVGRRGGKGKLKISFFKKPINRLPREAQGRVAKA
jgi:hypothetical protein